MEDLKTRDQNPLGFEPEGRLLYRFALPSVVALVVNSLYNIVDQIFIGQYIGFLGNAATNVTFPLVTIALSLALLLGIGSASRYSLLLGAGRTDQAKGVVGNCVIALTAVGVILMLLFLVFMPQWLTLFGATDQLMDYARIYGGICAVGLPFMMMQTAVCALIRADGSPQYSMISILVGAIINTILDPIFIAVFHMGIAGAAYATVIGQVASCFFALSYLPRFKQVKLKKEDFVFSKAETRMSAALGVSNFSSQITLTLVQVVLNNSIKHYGALSIYGPDIPLAAAGIVFKCNGILIAIFVGIAQGAQAIVGFNYGAKRYLRVRRTYFCAFLTTLAIGLIGFMAFQLIPDRILAIFGTGDSKLYFDFAIYFMRTFLFMVPVIGIQIVSSNFFASIGKPIRGLILSLSRTVICMIPALLILPLFFGLDGIIYAAPVSDAIACVVTMVFIFFEMRHLGYLAKVDHQSEVAMA